MLTIFVGDEPSRLNKDPNVAFIGSRSYPRLSEWIKLFMPDVPVAVNSNTVELLEQIATWHENGATIVALGNKASSRLKKLGIEHFKLPHPSPRNRLLNNPNFIDSELKKCKNYLRGKSDVHNLPRVGKTKNNK